MSKKNIARKTLLVSVISLILCCAMLVGTTFAWFTDSVTSGVNKITAGNLDIELEYSHDMAENSWATVQDTTKLFEENTLWEPGHTEVVYLRITNLGSLALQYQFNMTFTETEATNAAGESFKLSEHLMYNVVEVDSAYATRDAARDAVQTNAVPLASYSVDGEMTSTNAAKTVALVVYMPEDVGNEANYKTGTDVPTISLNINLAATQYTYEEDSFDKNYDDILLAPDNYYALLMDRWGQNSNYLLTGDLNVPDSIFFGDNTDNTINLNGNTLSVDPGNYLIRGVNCTLTIGGEGTVEANECVYASSSGTVNINGGEFLLGETTEKANLYCQNSATIVINDGTFISEDANTPILYCINGFIEINGGFFQNTANPNQALLSMGNNLNYINNQKITLRGGTFVNWNPMNSAFARPWTNPDIPALIVLADGYEVVSETQANGDIWYSVVPVQA